MARLSRPHDLARVTTNAHREPERAACAWCSCGLLFYGPTRLDALDAYTPTSLNVALAVTGAATAITYVAYTLDPATREAFNSNYLWLTAPFTLFGILRFLFLVSGRAGRGLKAESPTQEMLRDVTFVMNLVLWVIVVVAIVYRLRPHA